MKVKPVLKKIHIAAKKLAGKTVGTPPASPSVKPGKGVITSMKPLLIYNLFPRYYKTIDDWKSAIPHIVSMGFNSVFVNPFHRTGWSGSLYAVKDYYELNPLFLAPGQSTGDMSPVKTFTAKCRDAGLEIIMDLVVNHTAMDSDLAGKFPRWYKHDETGAIMSPFAVDPENPEKKTVWGDLAELDYQGSPERTRIIAYFDMVIKFYQGIGINGFRCDAAYKVPGDVWKTLITNAKTRNPQAFFLAESLGCTQEQTRALSGSGFDYLFNSSKWWNFDSGWCLEQHVDNKAIAPSISFPESHDTQRLAGAFPGSINMQKRGYFFSAVFSTGLMMLMGYQSGARKKTDVVTGSPADLEQPQWDLGPWIAKVNALKLSMPILCEEGTWKPVSAYDSDILFLQKVSDKGAGSVCVLINKDWTNLRTVYVHEFPGEVTQYTTMVSAFSDPSGKTVIPNEIRLAACEMVLLF